PDVLRAVPHAVLVVAGFPAPDFDEDATRRLARQLGVERALHLQARYIPAGAVHAWLRLADVMVLPHRLVYQSGALALAQTFGVPVVATRTGAMPEMVADGESGLLVEPGDASGMAKAIVRLLHDPELAGRLGRQGRADAA